MPITLLPDKGLLTPRLHLRTVSVADLPDLMAVNGDAAVTRFLPYAAWTSMADAQAWLTRMQDLMGTGTAHQMVLVARATQSVIGTMLAFKLDEGSARVEVGYALGQVWWRQGFMQEALQAWIAHGFQTLPLRRMEAEVNPDNVASNALLARLGFVLEGRLRQRWAAKGVVYDVNHHGLLAADFLAASLANDQARMKLRNGPAK